jgi:hypothetical protein
MAKFYDDIGQDSNDLLTKGYPVNGSLKVSAETKTADGVSLIATIRRFVKDKAVAVELGLEPKYEWAARNVELSGNVNTSAEYSGTATLKDVGTKGTKIGVTASSNAKGVSYKATTSLKNDNAAVKAAGTFALGDKPIVLEGSVVYAYEKRFFGGLSGNFTTSSGDKNAVVLGGAKVGVEQGDIQAHLSGNLTEKNLLIGVGWFQKISSALKIGANAIVDAKQVAGPAATLGSEYKFDDLTALKNKVGVQYHSDGSKPWEARLGVGLKHALSSNLTSTIAADVNVRQLLGTNAGADHSFGLEVKLI